MMATSTPVPPLSEHEQILEALARVERKLDILLRAGHRLSSLASWADQGPVDLNDLDHKGNQATTA
jgi:hypothetical protein